MNFKVEMCRERVKRTAGAILALGWHSMTRAAESAIPFKVTDAADDALIYRALAGFFVAVGLLLVLAWGIKRYAPAGWAPTRRDQNLQRLETLRLSSRSVLVRVRWGDEELLLGEGDGGIKLVARRAGVHAHGVETTQAGVDNEQA